jgi:hypothetical protein
MKTHALTTILVALMFIAVSQSAAQQGGSVVADSDAERLLDKAAQAEGADDVLRSLRTVRAKGSSFFGSSISPTGDFETIVKFPERFQDTSTSTGARSSKFGFDGNQTWMIAPGQAMTGLPKIQLLLPAVQWRARYTKAQFLGDRTVDGHKCHAIRARIRGQATDADYCYDANTFLLLQVEALAVLPGASTTLITFRISEYRNISGLKVPHEWVFGSNRTVVRSVKLNGDIPDKEFANPK